MDLQLKVDVEKEYGTVSCEGDPDLYEEDDEEYERVEFFKIRAAVSLRGEGWLGSGIFPRLTDPER